MAPTDEELLLKVGARVLFVNNHTGGAWVNGSIGDIVHIDAKHGEKDYHVNVPIPHKVDSDSPKATYTNGILELTFNLDTKPSGRSVDVL